MTILATVYASAPDSEVLIPTIELDSAGWGAPIRICVGFEDKTTDAGVFTAAGLDVALPARDTRGTQSLIFAIDNVTGEAQRLIDQALESGAEIVLRYRLYLDSDLSAPAEQPKVFSVTEATFTPTGTVQITASYKDLIGRAWPRLRYTADFAPGLKYQ